MDGDVNPVDSVRLPRLVGNVQVAEQLVDSMGERVGDTVVVYARAVSTVSAPFVRQFLKLLAVKGYTHVVLKGGQPLFTMLTQYAADQYDLTVEEG